MLFEKECYNLANHIKDYKDNMIDMSKPIDIVLEGGAFNGSFELGVLLLLHSMERKKICKIGRLSGTSIGSILGVCYLTNQLDKYLSLYNEIRIDWRENLNLMYFQRAVSNIVDSLDATIFNDMSSNKLYITYFNLQTQKQELKHIYKDKDDLKKTILRSCHIPFMIDNKMCFDNHYIDGIQPYIFNERNKVNNIILYVSINHLSILYKALRTKHEISPNNRIFEGILKCYDLFILNKSNYLCSFVHDWGLYDYIKLKIKLLVIMIFISFIYYLYKWSAFYKKYIACSIQNTIMYNHIQMFITDCYRDFIVGYCL